MGRKKTPLVAFALLLMSLSSLAYNIQPAKTTPTKITVPYDYPTIQEAINAATPGDIIYVYNGTYLENVVVNKTVALVGEDKYITIIDGGESETTLLITANNVSISGFTINNSNFAWPYGGVLMDNVSNCHISNIVTVNNWVGAWLEDSSNNTLSNITARNNDYGLWLVNSHNNKLSDDTFANNTRYGVWLQSSENNTLLNATVTSNEFGIQLEEAYHNTICHNKIINNTYQIANLWSKNVWDNGYPSGGNYWSDYTGVDLKSGPNQDQSGSDGLGDTPYIIDANNTDRYPLMNPVAVHDVAITNITTSKTVVGQGYSLSVNVQVKNEGNRLETVNVTVYINNTLTTQTINLTIGTATLTFSWNTTGFPKGNYTIKAYAWPVPGETNKADNTFTYGDKIIVTVPGDTDGDRSIDIYDIVRIASAYGAKRGEPRFIPNCDIDSNGVINIYDVVIATSRYGYKE